MPSPQLNFGMLYTSFLVGMGVTATFQVFAKLHEFDKQNAQRREAQRREAQQEEAQQRDKK